MLEDATDAIALELLEELELLLDEILELLVDEKLTLDDDKLTARLLDVFALDELLLNTTELLDELVVEEDLLLLPPQADSPTITKTTAQSASPFM